MFQTLADVIVDTLERKEQQLNAWSEQKEELWARLMTFLANALEEGQKAYDDRNLLLSR